MIDEIRGLIPPETYKTRASSPTPLPVFERELNLAPVVLPVSILQPFGLEVSLDASAGGGTASNILASFTASADAFDPQQTFLNPLGDFSLVAGSGHDYSVPASSGAVPEPSSLLLLAAGLVALVVTCRRLKSGLRSTGLA